MNSKSTTETGMKRRIQELSPFVIKIDQQIEIELAKDEPDMKLVRRLKQESENLKDTLKRAQLLAD